MAFTHGSKSKVYVNGFDMSPYLRNFQGSFSVDTAETSTFGNLFKTYVPGLTDGTFTADGIYDGATGAVDQVFAAALSNVSDDLITYLPQGETGVGGPAFGFASVATSYQVQGGVADVSSVQLQGQNDNGMDKSFIVHPLQAAIATGASVDSGVVSTTNGWNAILQAVTGSSLVVTLQDSADNSTFAAITGGAFTSFTGSNGSQRLVSAAGATVRRYVRAITTGTGTLSVIFCRK